MFEVPPEWLPDDIEPGNLLQVETDKPGGIFEISIVESLEDADNFNSSEKSYEDQKRQLTTSKNWNKRRM